MIKYTMTYILLLLPLGLFAFELQPYMGLAMGYGDKIRDTKFYNPQGRFGTRVVTDYFLQPYVEHISSVPNMKDGFGMNIVGLNVVSPSYRDLDTYIGYVYKPEYDKLNNKSYSRIFNHNFYRYGIRYKSGDKYLYIESLENRVYSLGVELVF